MAKKIAFDFRTIIMVIEQERSFKLVSLYDLSLETCLTCFIFMIMKKKNY